MSPNIVGVLVFMVINIIIFWIIYGVMVRIFGQKTRSQQQRRVYGGARGRPSSEQGEPTIFVSPANLPPPPKYEVLAPPSYEEVMGVNYDNFQTTRVQPITYPLTHAIAQSSNQTEPVATTTNRNNDATQTVITVTADERRTSVTVASS